MNNGHKEDSSSGDYCYLHPKEAVVGVCPLCLHDRLLVLAAAQQRHLSSSTTTSTTSSSSASAAGRHKKKPSILFALGSLLINRLEFRHPKSDLHGDGDDAHFPDYDYDCGDYGDGDDDDASTGTLEDSFISIQFQDNGVASWEKGVDLVSQSKNHDKKKKKDGDFSWSSSKKKKNSQSHRRDNPSKNSTIIMPFSSSSSSSQSCKDTSSSFKAKEQEEMMMSVIEHGKPRAGSMRWRKRIGHMFHLIRWKRSNSSKGNVCHVGSKVEGVKVVSSRNNKGWMRTLTKRRARE